jgi:hypothetical protein
MWETVRPEQLFSCTTKSCMSYEVDGRDASATLRDFEVSDLWVL